MTDLELAPGVRVDVHDVVVVVPEGGDVGGELDEDLDVARHLEHVDHLGLPGGQRRGEGDDARLEHAHAEGEDGPPG